MIHFLFGSREVYPVHFLKTYLFMVSIIGSIVFFQTGVRPTEYFLPAFLFWVAITLHLISAPRHRRYFGKESYRQPACFRDAGQSPKSPSGLVIPFCASVRASNRSAICC